MCEFGVCFLPPEEGFGDGEGAEAEFLGDAEFAQAEVVLAKGVGKVAAGKERECECEGEGGG